MRMFKHSVLRRAENEASNLNSRISREHRRDPINFMLSQSSHHRSFPLRCQSSALVDRARRESFTRDYPPRSQLTASEFVYRRVIRGPGPGPSEGLLGVRT